MTTMSNGERQPGSSKKAPMAVDYAGQLVEKGPDQIEAELSIAALQRAADDLRSRGIDPKTRSPIG
jgi:hypothetical protein